jgi:hypothetical protein
VDVGWTSPWTAGRQLGARFRARSNDRCATAWTFGGRRASDPSPEQQTELPRVQRLYRALWRTRTADPLLTTSGNWSQATATVFACLSRFGGRRICHRLPRVATAGLHKGSILRCLAWLRVTRLPAVRRCVGGAPGRSGLSRRIEQQGPFQRPCACPTAFSFVEMECWRSQRRGHIYYAQQLSRWGHEIRCALKASHATLALTRSTRTASGRGRCLA